MASRAEHDSLGIAIGGLAALTRCLASGSAESVLDVIVEVAGGMAGGKLGSRIPDGLEPPTSPHHRSTMHSVAITASVAYGGLKHAAPAANKLTRAVDDPVARALVHFLAGVMTGTPAGYVSHTLADAGTPRGIPLLV